MRHASNVGTAGHSRQSSESSAQTRSGLLSGQHMARLWTRLARMYGHRWTSSFGEADDGTWRAGLVGITPQEVAHGLGECAKRDDPWPPTLPEFRVLCRPRDGRTPEQRARDARIEDEQRDPLPSLEHVAGKSTTGRQWMALWIIDGLRPMPAGMTMDDVDAWMGDADIEAMRERVERERWILLGRYGHTRQTWAAA